jgi:hypothetical protein
MEHRAIGGRAEGAVSAFDNVRLLIFGVGDGTLDRSRWRVIPQNGAWQLGERHHPAAPTRVPKKLWRNIRTIVR